MDDSTPQLYAVSTFDTSVRPGQRNLDRSLALRALLAGQSVVYAMRLPDGIIKIGCSSQLWARRKSIHPKAEIIGFKFGDMDDEKAIHDSLRQHRARGREYYHPTSAVLTVVNEMRDGYGLPHIAA